MRTRCTHSIASIAGMVAVSLLALAIITVPGEARALELQLGGHLRIGGAAIEDDDLSNDQEPDVGPSGIGQIFAVVKFVDAFGAGLVLDGGASSHDTDGGELRTTTGTIGVILRSDPIDVLSIAAWIGYSWGEVEFDFDGTFLPDVDDDAEGFSLGFDAMYRLGLFEFPLFFEFGPYLTFGSYELDDSNGDDNSLYITFGAAAQVTYEIGL